MDAALNAYLAAMTDFHGSLRARRDGAGDSAAVAAAERRKDSLKEGVFQAMRDANPTEPVDLVDMVTRTLL